MLIKKLVLICVNKENRFVEAECTKAIFYFVKVFHFYEKKRLL